MPVSREEFSVLPEAMEVSFHCRLHHSTEIRCILCVNSISSCSFRGPIQGRVSVLPSYLFPFCMEKILPTAFHFQRGRCVSTRAVTFPYPHIMNSMYQEMFCLGIKDTLTLTLMDVCVSGSINRPLIFQLSSHMHNI